MVADAIDAALVLVSDDGRAADARRGPVEQEIAKAERERARYVAAIGAGGELSGLVDALRACEQRLTTLRTELVAIAQPRGSQAFDARRVREELQALGQQWRQVLTEGPEHARPIITKLLTGRVTFQPLEGRRCQMHGRGTIAGLFSREVFPVKSQD